MRTSTRECDMGDGYEPWTAEWRGGFACDISGRGFTFRADEPPSVGGGDSGPMPTEFVAIGLASCLCLAIAFAARKRDIDPGEIAVDVTPHRAGSEPRHGRYEVAVRGSLDQATLERLLESAKRVCWVSNTLRTAPEFTYRVDGNVAGYGGPE